MRPMHWTKLGSEILPLEEISFIYCGNIISECCMFRGKAGEVPDRIGLTVRDNGEIPKTIMNAEGHFTAPDEGQDEDGKGQLGQGRGDEMDAGDVDGGMNTGEKLEDNGHYEESEMIATGFKNGVGREGLRLPKHDSCWQLV